MKTHKQIMTMRAEPLMIDTAHGMIEIHRVDGDRRKLCIKLPEGLFVKIGLEKAIERSTWLCVTDTGNVWPKYMLLESVIDENGELKELQSPRPLKISRSAS